MHLLAGCRCFLFLRYYCCRLSCCHQVNFKFIAFLWFLLFKFHCVCVCARVCACARFQCTNIYVSFLAAVCVRGLFYWIKLQFKWWSLQMGVKGWHWSCWTLIHWSEIVNIVRRLRRFLCWILSVTLTIFQVGSLEICLMMIQNNGACTLTSLVVQEGLYNKFSFRYRLPHFQILFNIDHSFSILIHPAASLI